MCQNLFTRRTVQNVDKVIMFFVFFSHQNLKIRLLVTRKDPLLPVFDFLGLRDPQIRYFLFSFRTVGLLFVKFGKSSKKPHYCE